MSTIQETVTTTLNNRGLQGYAQYARPVIEALEEREQTLAGQIISTAAEFEVEEDEVRNRLVSLGMTVPPAAEPEPEESDEAEDSGSMGRIEQLLTRLTGQVDSLTEFARRNGYRS